MDRLKAIEVFITVVDEGSLTNAANKLGISRSMATRYLSSLEQQLNTRLLERSTRSLGVTSAGKQLLPYCQNLLIHHHELLNAAQQQTDTPQGNIRITCSISLGQLYLSEMVKRFMTAYPKVSVEMSLASNTIEQVKETFDLAIQITNTLPEQLIARKIAHCHSVICASPKYLHENGIPATPTELANHNCLIHPKTGHQWGFLDPISSVSLSIPVSGNLRANDTQLLVNAALTGQGIVYLPVFAVQTYLQQGHLIQIFPQYQLDKFGIWALYLSWKYQTTLQRTFLDFLIKDFSDFECIKRPITTS